jgi:hypothetical protein
MLNKVQSGQCNVNPHVAGLVKLQAGPEDDKNGTHCGLELYREIHLYR